jgi:hypothetical protein
MPGKRGGNCREGTNSAALVAGRAEALTTLTGETKQ